ncbi:MAG: stage II sporulation protein D [Clostridia bacterium]|nr:stage II sporulation protein D [Clostridia bacterium]MBO7289490.1 stage II sporulation protein D [Clostridia bacterium]
MKFISSILAFLIVVYLILPFSLSSCVKTQKENSGTIISLYDKNKDEIVKMNIEEYLVNVVSAEMPSSFAIEALKAQTVAARTYALRKINKNLPEHKGADLCTDFSHCQAYSYNSDLKSKWGNSYLKNYKKIKSAVDSTAGQYLAYDNDYAITVFHSCSNGITEKASEVWGGSFPYLVNVDSPGDYLKKDYITKAVFSEKEFENIIKNKFNNIDFSNEAIGDISYTSGSNVKDIVIFGKKIKGTDIRKMFSLKSSSFSIDKKAQDFVFTVSGNGHGVGMSQYGAEKMARDKQSYKEILSHFYPGTELKKV